MSLTLTITVDDESELTDAICQVAQLVEEGFTFGNHPTWDINKDES